MKRTRNLKNSLQFLPTNYFVIIISIAKINIFNEKRNFSVTYRQCHCKNFV